MMDLLAGTGQYSHVRVIKQRYFGRKFNIGMLLRGGPSLNGAAT